MRVNRDRVLAKAGKGMPEKSTKRQTRSPPDWIRLRTVSAVVDRSNPDLVVLLLI